MYTDKNFLILRNHLKSKKATGSVVKKMDGMKKQVFKNTMKIYLEMLLLTKNSQIAKSKERTI